MKYTLLIFFLTAAILRGGAQTNFSLSSYDVKAFVHPDSFEVKGRMTLVNTSNQSKKFVWQRQVTTLTSGWYCMVCEKNQCWAAATPSPLDYIDLAAGATANLDIYVRPDKKAGTAAVDIRVYEVGNEANAVSGKYFFSSNMKAKDSKLPNDVDINIFPNPAIDFFMLPDNSGVDKIVIYNIIGRQMRSIKTYEGAKYNINDLPEGFYIVRLLNVNGSTIKTIRLNKTRVKA